MLSGLMMLMTCIVTKILHYCINEYCVLFLTQEKNEKKQR
jgi:hypothetical protein